MNVEELKLIIELLRGVSSDVSSVALWWIVGHYASQLLVAAFWVAGPVTIAWMIVRALRVTTDWGIAGRQMAVAWGGDGGANGLFKSDEEAVRKVVSAGFAQTEQEKRNA